MLETVKYLQACLEDIDKQVDENETIVDDLVRLVRSLEKRVAILEQYIKDDHK